MPQSRLPKMNRKTPHLHENEIKIPEQKADYCVGECDVQVIGYSDDNKPLVYCLGGCGRKMGR